MTAPERKAAVARVRTFNIQHPGFMEHLPAVIIGAEGRDICMLDATLADLRAYQGLVKARIRRMTAKTR